MKARLDKWLVHLSLGSRRDVQQMIRSGSVCVNGGTVRDPGSAWDTEKDKLRIGGRELDGRTERHVMLHKPAGILTAARDSRQPTVMDLLPPVYAGIGCMPVGRLDKDTTGLLLLTTDGQMNHLLLAPGRHVDKRYCATVTGRLTEAEIERFAEGIALSDFTALPAELRIVSAGDAESAAEVTVREGKYHQVRRMFSAVGHEVLRLHRASFGPLELDNGLAPGEWRELTGEELARIRRAAGMEES